MNARSSRRFPALILAVVVAQLTARSPGKAGSTNPVSGEAMARVRTVAPTVLPTLESSSPTNALVSTVGSSRQFTVYAQNRLLASAMCVYAERVKREWLRVLNATDRWRDPILVVVHSREAAEKTAPAIFLQTYQTDEHLSYQVYCLVPPPLDDAELLRALVESLCAEWANRDQSTHRGQAYVVPRMPPWLVQGIAESIQGRGDLLLPIARRSVAAGRPENAADLLMAKGAPPDPAERALFQANAWMFTDGLLNLPDGAERLQRFLTELGAQKVVSNAFWAVYRDEFPQELSLEKWWSLQQASRTAFVVAEELTAQETARQLDEILMTRLDPTSGRRGIPGDKEVTIDRLWRYDEAPWLGDVLDSKLNRLAELRSQAHPLYRPAIDTYTEALGWLMRQSTVRFRRAVRRADILRAAAEQRSRAIAAYLDQAERVYDPDEFSHLFANYSRTLDWFQQLENERQNPISDYLDKFDH